ncbi:MAG: S26 family signal peptidase [Phenylobacterium sp.]|uniref:S26 family signal peptidase n=1 Tax=Phenylobacterium sp. TaxID=1871053 RepID=UPI002733B939|nr:S26 family signal peptidase [Phenylobacterium sp.]MDP3747819.1 S26 family signal peptidase [Phenylobacterium sp.]
MIRIPRPSRTEGALLALAGLAWSSQFTPTLAVVNESASLPRGLYLRAPGAQAERGAIVAVPAPPAARPYLSELGAPAGARLLKRVAAVGGERVCAGRHEVQTPERRVTVPRRDRRGRPLPAWRDCRNLAPDELFLLGDTPSSFDSRFFGPVRRAELDGVYREALTW